MSTGGDDRDEFTEDWFEDAEQEPGGFRDPDAETWLEEPAPPAAPRDRRPLIALLAVVALIVIGIGLARVIGGGGDNNAAETTRATTAQTQSTASTETQTTSTGPTITVPDDATLHPGDSGDSVEQLQKALIALNYDPGKADGSYGPSTQEAVKKFQSDSGLDADGIAGPATLKAINDALAAGG